MYRHIEKTVRTKGFCSREKNLHEKDLLKDYTAAGEVDKVGGL